MKVKQHEHCLFILMFRKTWLILYPFLASCRCWAVSPGPLASYYSGLCQSCFAGVQNRSLYLSPPAELRAQPA